MTDSQIEVRVDDIAFAEGDAIAWPVTDTLHATTPLLRKLELAGGTALATQLQISDPLPVGSAVVTGAGDLGVDLLVSAVIRSATEPVTGAGVRRALTSALQRAADWQIARLVLTPFGLGAGNLDIDETAAITADLLARHMAGARYPTKVTMVVESDEEAAAFAARFPAKSVR
ncbi:MAG: macro domain-containing protein [Gemmatimonadaceae bacterium]